MPYIVQSKRDQLNPTIIALCDELMKLETDARNNMEGNINYVITKLLKTVYASELSYRAINDAIGVLECVKQEFYRVIATQYEIQKSYDHGEII